MSDTAGSGSERQRDARFLSEADHSLAADLVRAANEVALNAQDQDIYLPEERARYRALAMRLYEHGLTALRTTAGSTEPCECLFHDSHCERQLSGPAGSAQGVEDEVARLATRIAGATYFGCHLGTGPIRFAEHIKPMIHAALRSQIGGGGK